MKIATFNINNINSRRDNLLRWLKVAKPDVVCLQELKATDRDFPEAAINRAGYGAIWRGEPSWNGVAILARDAEPILTADVLPGDRADKQNRYIEAAVNGVIIASLYAPNGNPQPGPKFAYKLAWTKRLIAHAAELLATGVPVVLAGDYNIVPTDFDIYRTTSYKKNALVQPQPRKLFAELLEQGWTDAIRTLHPDAPMYTFWDYMRERWPRDAGLRLDHLLLSKAAAKRLTGAGVDREVRGRQRASDHAPAWIELKDTGKDSGKRTAKKSAAKTTAAKKAATKPAAKPKPSAAKPGKGPLLVIDGDSFAHRSYHALPKSILRKGKRPAGAIVGFANMLLRLYREEKPRAVVVGWDTLEKPTYRNKLFPAYQSGRKFDAAIVEQLKVIPKLVAACGFVNAKGAGYEADDFLAAAVAAEEKRGGKVLVASGDRDSFQLASKNTTILYPVRAGEVARIGPAEVVERYGVQPHQVPDFIALRGDTSDKLPGAAGVGATGAATLLRQHGSLEAAFKAGRFPGKEARLRMFRSVATMDRKAPLPSSKNQTPTWDKAATLASEWELNALAKRLGEIARS